MHKLIKHRPTDSPFIAGWKLTLYHAVITFLIMVIDVFSYIQASNTFMLAINVPVLVLLLVSIIHVIIRNKTWENWLLINFSSIILNISISVVIRAYQNPFESFLLQNTLYAVIIVLASGVMLKRGWTYVYAIFFILSMVGSFLLSKGLFDTALVSLSLVVLGSAFAADSYISKFNRTVEIADNLKCETQSLQQILDSERKTILNVIGKIERKTNNQNLDINSELAELKSSFKNGLPSTITNYIEQGNTDESVFIKKLTNLYPSLSPSELRICILLRNNFSTKEIAAEISCAPNSVKVFRSRIRKKMNLPTSVNIVTHLHVLE